jgi:glycosyltransferase involved in cell wall biosynthesis
MKLLYAGEKWIYKKADKLIFTMEGGRDYIIDKGWDTGSGGPIDLKKVFHINNGVDLEEYNYNKTRFSFPDEDLDKDNTFKIIYTGSLRAENNQIWALLKTAELFKDEKYKDIIFLIYGDGPERSLLEYYCEERALKNVHIKGRVEKKYIPYILSQADINILNCEKYDVLKYGGSQNKLFEYLASGHPIITAEATKYSVVRKYNCGIAWDFKDAQEIKEAILELKNLEPNQLAEMQKNINTTALKYDFGNLTKELIEIIGTGGK